jgi:hypothetical protein
VPGCCHVRARFHGLNWRAQAGGGLEGELKVKEEAQGGGPSQK